MNRCPNAYANSLRYQQKNRYPYNRLNDYILDDIFIRIAYLRQPRYSIQMMKKVLPKFGGTV